MVQGRQLGTEIQRVSACSGCEVYRIIHPQDVALYLQRIAITLKRQKCEIIEQMHNPSILWQWGVQREVIKHDVNMVILLQAHNVG